MTGEIKYDETHPYGVEVGDMVHHWPGNPPPLGQTYIAPPCQNALVLGFTWDERSIWLAHLAVVDKTGGLHIVTAVPQVESFAQTSLESGALSSRSYGAPASWHRAFLHDESRSLSALAAARLEVKAAVEEWFSDVSLDDLFAVKGWNAAPDESEAR